jgi:hypothetical protein
MTVGAEDALALLEDFGDPVVLGGVRTTGILSRREVLETDGAGGQVQVTRRVLRIVTGALPGLTVDAELTVDGVGYQVRYPELVAPDDVFTDVWLTPV